MKRGPERNTPHDPMNPKHQEAKTAMEGKTPEEIAAALKELPPDQLAKMLGPRCYDGSLSDSVVNGKGKQLEVT